MLTTPSRLQHGMSSVITQSNYSNTPFSPLWKDFMPIHGMDLDAETLPFDTALGYEPVSPCLHPNDPNAWLDHIPVLGEEKRKPAPKINIQKVTPPPNKYVHLFNLVDMEETAYLHVKKAAEWFTENGPAPTTLEERWSHFDCDKEVIYMLIFMQHFFYGEDSISPWQKTYLFELQDIIRSRVQCNFCGSPAFEWCQLVVPRS